MAEKKKKSSGYVSKHTAPEKKDMNKDSEQDLSFIEDDAAAAESKEASPGADKRAEKPRKTKRGRQKRELSEEEKARRAEQRRDRHRRIKITLSVLLCVVILLIGAATAGGYMVTHSGKIFPNVYVGGVYVGGMDEASALAAIEESGWQDKAETALKVRLFDKVTFKIDRYASGAMNTPADAADHALAYGHGSNWYLNLWEYLKCLITTVEINDSTISYDTDYISSQCLMGIDKLNKALGDGSWEVDEEASVLRLTKGAGALSFNVDDMTSAVISALADDKTELSYSTLASDPEAPDFQAIFDELSAEPADAYYTDDNTFTVVDGTVGCDFDVDTARSLWTAAEITDTVEIPITLTYPEVTGDYLRSLLYRDKLGAMTTYFKSSSDDRISNIKLAAGKINGLILYPGDVFSYNDTIGQRTEEAGFKMAGAYSNGEVVQEIGGGICQVSSTLYSAMLYSYKLTTVARSPHYFPVDYMEKGYDATVSWPSPDFKFRNDRDYPVKIVTYVDEYEKALTVEIWGTNLDGTYIELTKDTYSYNNDRYDWIMEGYGVQVHRLVFDANGMQIDQIDEVYDVYHTHEATEQIKALDEAAKQAEAAADGSGDGLTVG